MLPTLSESLNCIKEIGLCFFVAVYDGLSWVLGELLVFYYKLVEVVSQEVSACISTMPIKNPKEAAFRPVGNILLCWWLHNIQYNRHSVFIVISDYTLICIRGISHYNTIFPNTAFGRLPAWQIEYSGIRGWPIAEKELFDIERFHLLIGSLIIVWVTIDDWRGAWAVTISSCSRTVIAKIRIWSIWMISLTLIESSAKLTVVHFWIRCLSRRRELSSLKIVTMTLNILLLISMVSQTRCLTSSTMRIHLFLI